MGGWKIHMVSHTHWDREWYLPYQVFRARLVRMIDTLLDILSSRKDFRYFTLDGQTIVLEDYLEIRLDKEEELRRYIREGRILIGPWYILPDEFLVSGESLIRNLMLGEKVAERFGRIMRIGYLPDPFGHIQEMPQILRGFDIDNFVFWRGYSVDESRKSEFVWEAKDGSEVIAVNLPDGYFNAYNITLEGVEAFKRKVQEKAERLKPYATTKNILLMNGEDHLFPEEKLPEYMKEYQREHPEDSLIHSNLEIFVDEIRKVKHLLNRFTGELRDCRRTPILSGVLSTRMYLKQENHSCEVLLEKFVEPLTALAYALGMEYPSHLIWQAWKYLLQNQTHDGICGTSVDEVHREMLTRYEWVKELSTYLIKEAITHIGGDDAKQENGKQITYLVFNPLNWEVREKVEISLPDDAEYAIERADGGSVGYDTLGKSIIFVDEFPPLGYRSYRLRRIKRKRCATPLKFAENIIENEFLRVSVNDDGTVDLEDKRFGMLYQGLNLFVDEGDAGDEYNFSPPEDNKVVTNKGCRAIIGIVKGNSFSRATVKLNLLLPEGLSKDRKSRKKRKVRCPVRITYTLYQGIPRLDVKVSIENRARDHRLRVLFPTGIRASKSVAASHFGVIERETGVERWDDSWIEVPQPTKPMKGWVDLSDGIKGFMIASKGLPEYEATPDGEIYLTLLRCVGWLSRGDLRTRRIRAGPTLQTPEAQCPGRHEFEYSIIPHLSSGENALQLAHQFIYSPQSFETSGAKNSDTLSFISLTPPLIVSSVKKAENSGELVIRFYNPTERKIEGKLSCTFPVEEIRTANLREKESSIEGVEIIERREREITLQVAPYKIVTLKLKIKRAEK